MKIIRYYTNPLEVIDNLEKIVDKILILAKNKFPEAILSYFSLSITKKDEGIDFKSLYEFTKYNKKNLINITGFHAYFIVSRNAIVSVLPSFFQITMTKSYPNNLQIGIEMEMEEENIHEEIFSHLFSDILTTCEQIKYNPNKEKSQQKKEKEENIKKSVYHCINILERLESYQEKIDKIIESEKSLQKFLFPILKSHFNSIEDELGLPRFGANKYVPDFGVSELNLLIETKYLYKKEDLKRIQKEIIDDSIGYLTTSKEYKSLIVLIYNSKNFPVPEKFIKDLEKIKGLVKVIISPGITPK